jgi:hypothetical protein
MSCLAQLIVLLTSTFRLYGSPKVSPEGVVSPKVSPEGVVSPKVSPEGVVRTKCHIYVFLIHVHFYGLFIFYSVTKKRREFDNIFFKDGFKNAS